MSSDLELRKRLSFEQAEGLEPLPQQLKLKEITPPLRAMLWRVFYESIGRSIRHNSMGGPSWIDGPWRDILYRKHVYRDHGMADDFDPESTGQIESVKVIFKQGDYAQVFGFVQFVLRDGRCPAGLHQAVERVLIGSHAAYRLVDGDTIVPISSEYDAKSITQAFADLSKEEFAGARVHLRNASNELASGNYAASVRESIHAVEALARTLEPSANTLDPALKQLEKGGYIHPALKAGFGKLYGYTNDEHGIRHPLLEEADAKVDEVDALYMFGSCAAFVSYLIGKTRTKSE